MNISEEYQRELFPYAYNILGTIDDAHDVIQDVMANHIESDPDNINNESAYLIKSVINKSINLKKRSKKMVGQTTWLPEPIGTENADQKINRQEIISYAMLVLLEYLNPKERAVFILKQAFDYSHVEIAEIFSITIETSRQLLSRAKNTLKKHGSDFALKTTSSDHVLSKYVDIIRKGDVKMLEEMLSGSITALADGGGKGKMLSEFTTGANAVAVLAFKGSELLKKCRIEFGKLNHLPTLLFYKGDKLICCQIFDVDTETGKIRNLYLVADPRKLKNYKKS